MAYILQSGMNSAIYIYIWKICIFGFSVCVSLTEEQKGAKVMQHPIHNP